MAGERPGAGRGAGAGLVGTALRLLVGACFLGGVVAAITGRLVLAGGSFLAGHTLLGGAAVIQGQRRRGVGFSLLGLGWLLLSLGLAVGQRGPPGPEQPLFLGGAGLVVVGAVLLVGAFGD